MSNVPVWISVIERYPVSGIVTLEAGVLIPAGSPVAIVGLGGEATLLTSADVGSKTATCNVTVTDA